nr:hypothetical protein [Tanacetum cinerariifolium]
MVNTRTDAELAAAVQNTLQTLLPQSRAEIREEFRTAVQNALQTLLPQIRAEIRKEFRTSSGPSDAGGKPTSRPRLVMPGWSR